MGNIDVGALRLHDAHELRGSTPWVRTKGKSSTCSGRAAPPAVVEESGAAAVSLDEAEVGDAAAPVARSR